MNVSCEILLLRCLRCFSLKGAFWPSFILGLELKLAHPLFYQREKYMLVYFVFLLVWLNANVKYY